MIVLGTLLTEAIEKTDTFNLIFQTQKLMHLGCCNHIAMSSKFH